MSLIAKELPDPWWNILEPLMPKQKGSARPYRDHRMVIAGILWCLRTGAPWRDLPSAFGPWQTVYKRFVRWIRNGFWQLLIKTLQASAEASGMIDGSLFCVDGTNVRAGRAAAGAPTQKKTMKNRHEWTRDSVEAEADTAVRST